MVQELPGALIVPVANTVIATKQLPVVYHALLDNIVEQLRLVA